MGWGLDHPIITLLAALAALVVGPGAATWAVLKWRVTSETKRLNGLVDAHRDHLREEKVHRELARDRLDELNRLLTEERHARQLLAKQIETICPYWDHKRAPPHGQK